MGSLIGAMVLKPLVSFMEGRGCFRMIDRLNIETKEVEPYLYRGYILRAPWVGVYLHQIWSSDPDHPHDHPWFNISWILKGGYYEFGVDGNSVWRTAGAVIFRPAQLFHRLAIGPHAKGGTWTIFIHFRRKRKWGFITPDGWLEAKVYGEKYDSTVEQEGAGYRIEGWLFPRVVEDVQ